MFPTHTELFAHSFISIEEVQKRAPSAFTKLPSHNISTDYLIIPTPDVITDLGDIGWIPIDAYQVKPKKASNIGLQKHFIKFRNPKHFIGSKKEIRIVPELLLVNSYDAKCSLKFYINMRSLIGNRDMIINSERMLMEDGREKMNIPHKGYRFHDYPELSRTLEESVEIARDLLQEFADHELSDQELKDIAQESCRARWDYKYQLLKPKLLLQRWREEDKRNDLLTVSYVLQEKLVEGGWTGSGGRTIKPIKDPNRALLISKKLFQILENFHHRTI